MTKPSEKTLFEQKGKCPYCSGLLINKVVKKTITPGVKAQTKIEGWVMKDTQSTLEKDYQESIKKGRKHGSK